MRTVGWIVVASVALGGCRWHFDPRDPFAGDGGGDDGGGGGDDDGGVGAPCNLITRVADDFEDNTVDPDLWGGSFANPGTSYDEIGGEMVIAPAVNAADQFAAYQTYRFYDLTGQRVSAEVTQVAAAGATTSFQLIREPGWSVAIIQKNDNFVASSQLNGVFMAYMTIPYVPAVHRYWAMEEAAGKLRYLWSTDGVAFTMFAEIDAPFAVTSLRVSLQAGTDGAVAAPGTAHFGILNNGTAVAGDACKVSRFVDRFDDGVIGVEWENSYSNPCCTLAESGGVTTITSDGTVGYAALRTSAGYDLRDSQMVVSLATPPTAASELYAIFRARPDPTHSVEIRLRDDTVQSAVDTNGTLSTMMAVRTAGEIHLRLRETAGTLLYEISSDKVAWRLLRSVPTPFPLDDVTLSLQAGTDMATTPASLSFDDFGVP